MSDKDAGGAVHEIRAAKTNCKAFEVNVNE
jgi:hypothetical protein